MHVEIWKGKKDKRKGRIRHRFLRVEIWQMCDGMSMDFDAIRVEAERQIAAFIEARE